MQRGHRAGGMRPDLVAVFLVSAVLIGCATNVRSVPRDGGPSGADESIVIGRIDLSEKFHPIWPFTLLARPSLKVNHLDTGTRYVINGDESAVSSAFYVQLPAGRYALLEVEVGNARAPVAGWFSVPGGTPVYVGTLRATGEGVPRGPWEQTGERSPLTDTGWVVDDRYEEKVGGFQRRYPNLDGPVTRSLFETVY